jgi:beta-lactamase class A
MSIFDGDRQRKIEGLLQDFAESGGDRSISLRIERPSTFSFSIQGQVPRPAASVVKFPLAITLYDLHFKGHINLEDEISVADLGKTEYQSIFKLFAPSRKLSIRELVLLALATSDNPAAEFLFNLAGVQQINHTLEALGCSNKSRAAVGFDDSMLSKQGRANVLTADDCNKIFIETYSLKRYRELYFALTNNLRNTRIPLYFDESIRIPHKTGSLSGVVNDAGVIVSKEALIYISVFTDHQEQPDVTSQQIGQVAFDIWQEISSDG